MNTNHKQLFGGALLCAGLAIGVASPDAMAVGIYDFQFSQNIPNAVGAGWGYVDQLGYKVNNVEDYEVGIGGGLSAGYAFNGGYTTQTVDAQLSPSGVWLDAYNFNTPGFSDFAFAYATVNLDVVVDQKLNITYNFGADGGNDFISVYGFGAGFADITYNGNGTGSIDLVAGNQYVMLVFVDAGKVEGDDFAYIHIKAKKIPTPGILAILGAGGLIGARRRRD